MKKQEMGVPTPQELKELAVNLPPYSAERDCGFEALSVFEEFGGNIIIAQQGFEDDGFYDGIYSVEKTTVPSDLSELVGPNAHGIFIWWGITYCVFRSDLNSNYETLEQKYGTFEQKNGNT